MDTKLLNVVVVTLLLLTLGQASAEQVSDSDVVPSDTLNRLTSISNPDQALEQAFRFTGFGQLAAELNSKTKYADVSVSVYSDSTFPFLFADLNGRTCWCVTLDSLYLAKGKGGYFNGINERPKHVDIFIDSASGEFVKAVLTAYGPDSTGLPPELPAATSTRLMSPNEKYLSLVDHAVPTTFVDALTQPMGKAASAYQTIVYLVNYSRATYPATKPCWIIVFRGVVPLPSLGPHPVPEVTQKVGRIRVGVDANTAGLLFAQEDPL